MWIDVGNLIRQHIPDKNGNSLPENLTMGSYEIREVGHRGIGSLFEGKVVFDKTYGHVTYGCASCCGYKLGFIDLYFNPLGIPDLGTADQGVQAFENCDNQWEDISGDFDYSWTTANGAIATVDAYGTHTGHSIGSTTTKAYAQETVYEKFGDCPLSNVYPGGNDNTLPTITGPNTLWYFGGQDPNGSVYPISITLSENAGSGTWAVTSGSDRINLSTTSGTNTTLTPTGAHFSGAPGDTCLTVTVSGQTSDPFCITVRTPWELSRSSTQTDSDPVHGWVTYIDYDLYDNLSSKITQNVYWNEALGANQSENGSNWASCCGPVRPNPGTTAPLTDVLEPPAINNSPAPSPTPTYHNPPSGTTIYLQVPQTIYVGSTTALAVQVQTDNLTYWIDHGTHENIVTPTKPPQ